MITVFSIDGTLNFTGLFQLPSQTLAKDWHGQNVTTPLNYHLALTPDALWLGAHRLAPGDCDQQIPCGTFTEKLWERDCVELFLHDDTSGSYQEFNLSPRGAWWTCAFSEPRNRMATQKPKLKAECFAETEENSWRAALRFPRSQLAISWGGTNQSRANVTAILDREPQRFLSANPLQSVEPDFHRPAEFQRVQVVRSFSEL